MTAATVLLILSVCCAATAAACAVLMAAWLDRRGIGTPLPLLRLFVFRNLAEYRRVTRTRTGKTGVLYRLYLIMINLAWVLALAAALTRCSVG